MSCYQFLNLEKQYLNKAKYTGFSIGGAKTN